MKNVLWESFNKTSKNVAFSTNISTYKSILIEICSNDGKQRLSRLFMPISLIDSTKTYIFRAYVTSGFNGVATFNINSAKTACTIGALEMNGWGNMWLAVYAG